ncbi:tetratricopeptide repeat protein [Amycolatopsis sp. OK19-0408]|uniref:Tetratricopeptide repeat protein n=1 Tax=Amycolatopsis iheyensis TaxID=2945988 RepID=A0A9X2SI94_9PSEU|nr:tetratricopeptide repeat protein [Amycolatopsis iheyensis]MCR6482693.1 tetratricopeptide repeat protein [Amycolatopsis iheyensis]
MGGGRGSDGDQRWGERLAAAFRRTSDHPAGDGVGQRDDPAGGPGHHPTRLTQDATASESGVVQQAGRDLNNTYVLPSRQPVELPYQAGLMPPAAPAFQTRAATKLVVAAVAAGDAVVLTTKVLSGLGGVGKTQLAVNYAETLWAERRVDLLVWVTAGSREAIVSTYAKVAEAVTGRAVDDPEEGARRLLEWLRATSASWLVVLDDLQDPRHLDDLWPPRNGQVLVTTRRRDAALRGRHRRIIDVDVFTPEEAHAYLAATFAGHLLDGADELAAELGFLPLALAQASAYALDRVLSCREYLARFTDRQRSLGSHQETVATTWSISIELADSLDPVGLARPLLEIAALLDPNGIPLSVFTTDTVAEMLDATPEQARDGLSCLHRLSLITFDPASNVRSVRVHALVQRAVQDQILDAAMPALARGAADALLEAWPEIERDVTVGQVLRTNVDTLASLARKHLLSFEVHPALFHAGISLARSGLVSRAATYFRGLHEAAEETLGPDHADTMTCQQLFANWRGEAGDVAGAIAALEHLLANRIRVLGADHPHVLATRTSLARYHGHAGDPAGAVAAYEEVTLDSVRLLGPDHINTLTCRHGIAYWRGRAGDHAGAVADLEQLLADLLRVLGPDDRHTLTARANLARYRGHAGDSAGAVAAHEKIVADRIRLLGPDNPETLMARANLASWRGRAGDPAGAAAALQDLLADRRRVLGLDHPNIAITEANLEYWRTRANE